MADHFHRGKYRDEHRVIGPALKTIENSYDLLKALPERDAVRFFRLDAHEEAAAARDRERAFRHLFSDSYNLLKFFWWTSVFKARQLAEALIAAYNTDSYLSWLILGRSSLEYAAVSYYFVKKFDGLALEGPAFKASSTTHLGA